MIEVNETFEQFISDLQSLCKKYSIDIIVSCDDPGVDCPIVVYNEKGENLGSFTYCSKDEVR